jgi:hypothetical protein
MDVIAVQAALPHIFDQQVIRKVLILDIGVCIMEGRRGRRRLLSRLPGYEHLTSLYILHSTVRLLRSDTSILTLTDGLSGFLGVC